MILNGYDTTIGSRYKVKDKAEQTIKMLQSTDRLELIDTAGVYAVSMKTDNGLPPFIYPISMQNYMREKVTIFDQRTYFNKNGQNVNQPEYNVMMLAAKLQQDLHNGKTTLIKSARPYTIKAFANALARKLERDATLDYDNSITLRIILAYYYVCLLENPDVDVKYIAQNSIRTALGYPVDRIQETIDGLGYVGTLEELLKVIHDEPTLFSLKRLDMSGLVQAGTTMFYSTSGFRQLAGAALEMPTLFTALCWGAVTQKIYQNTPIGEELDPRRNKNVSNFISLVNYYDNSI